MQVDLQVQEVDLWERFDSLSNEMIITKNGRCLFPLLRLVLSSSSSGDENLHFAVGLVRLDSARWKRRHGRWQAVGKFEEASNASGRIPIAPNIEFLDRQALRRMQWYEPEESPLREMPWSGSAVPLSFSRLKLTNSNASPEDPQQQQQQDRHPLPNVFSLSSFCRYRPVILLAKIGNKEGKITMKNGLLIPAVADSPIITASFIPKTEFIAVTHYQNNAITCLKKAFNPHAKGFISKSPEGGESALDAYEIAASRALQKLSSTLQLSSSSQIPINLNSTPQPPSTIVTPPRTLPSSPVVDFEGRWSMQPKRGRC